MRNAVIAPDAIDDIPVLTLFKRFAMIAIALTLAVVTIWMLLVPVPALAHDSWNDNRNGDVCRDYTRTLLFEHGRTQTLHGTACLRGDGNWYVVRESDNRPRASNYGTSRDGYRNGPARVTFRDNRISDRGWVYYSSDWEDLDDWNRHGRKSFNHDWSRHNHR